MQTDSTHFTVRLAQSDRDLRAAERLRYDVFVRELGGSGPLIDHDGMFERDAFDPYFDHLILVDDRRECETLRHVVGVYRLMRSERAVDAGQFYSESEYDIGVLKHSGKRLLELGRSCVHADYRGGIAMLQLWYGLAKYVRKHEIDILFGVASFHGNDLESLAEPLSLLYDAHLAPPDLRVRALENVYQSMDLVPVDNIDRTAAMRAVPALIKAYLRFGGFVGDGAFIDHAFNTTDVCLVMDTTRLTARAQALYDGARG